MEYSLIVTNNSTMFHDLCVYQKPMELGVPTAVPLAWLCAPAWPKTTIQFAWTVEYGFVWSPTPSLKPGTQFTTREMVPADPNDRGRNQIQFGYRKGTFAFIPGPADGDPAPGSLHLRQLSGIPADTAAVGIGMAESATFAAPALPDVQLAFTPHPSYWITAGTFVSGQVLDLAAIIDEAEVPFENTHELHATLNPDHTWTVTG